MTDRAQAWAMGVWKYMQPRSHATIRDCRLSKEVVAESTIRPGCQSPGTETNGRHSSMGRSHEGLSTTFSNGMKHGAEGALHPY